ncbi:MAG: helix-hairpin-helix domain-containing protein, partial [Acidobacteria bacterium]|nr:helix-hairpin-helix domain-containing protein [Acidobacteriota bacterium]
MDVYLGVASLAATEFGIKAGRAAVVARAAGLYSTMPVPFLLATACLALLLSGSGNKPAGAVTPQSPGLSKTAAKHEPARVNVNRATIDELKTLPGIGEATARRIVEY